ncbi:hypothetical protein WL045_12400 [Vibrio alginolyticus]
MAEEQLQGADAPKGKSKLLIIIIAVVVLLLGGGAAAFFLMGSDEPAQAESSQQAQVKASDAAPGKPVIEKVLFTDFVIQ